MIPTWVYWMAVIICIISLKLNYPDKGKMATSVAGLILVFAAEKIVYVLTYIANLL